MRFLNSGRILSNMRLTTEYLGNRQGVEGSRKLAFMKTINGAQSTSIRVIPDDVYIEFDNPDLVNVLIQRSVFSSRDVENDRHLISDLRRQNEIRRQIHDARALIRRADPHLEALLSELIGSIAAYDIPDRDGGTVSCCIGLIWLSPKEDWDTVFYAEMLVHEFIHNTVFLEDMVRGVMPTPNLLDRPEAFTTSVIRKTKRPFDKALHSACVAAGISYFYHQLGQHDKAAAYLGPIQQTLNELRENNQRMKAEGLAILSTNGQELLAELTQFAKGFQYRKISESLADDGRIQMYDEPHRVIQTAV